MNDDDFANIGLKPSMKIPMLNGSLECTLREYVMFDGSYNDFRAEGGRVREHDGDTEDRGPRKMRRLSEDEWKKETRKFGGHTERGDRNSIKKKSRDGGNGKENRRDGGYHKNDRHEGGYHKDDRREGRGGSYGKESRRDGGYHKNDRREGREARKINDRGPSISADREEVINPVHFRRRKQKRDWEDEGD